MATNTPHIIRGGLPGAWIAGILALLVLGGCERVLDLDPPEHQSQLVVIAVFDPDSPWQVEVRRTVPLSTGGRKDSTAVEDAVVTVYRGDTLVTTLDYTPERERLAGIYTAEGVFPEPGVVYAVRVSAPGFEDVEGSGHIPLVRTTPEVTFVDSLRFDPSRRRWLAELRIRDRDPAEEQNYYLLEMMEDIGDGLFRTSYETQDPILQDTPLIQLAGESSTLDRVFGDGAINGRVFEVSGEIERVEANAFGASLVHLSEAYYRYLVSLGEQEANDRSPFAGPTRPYSNVRGGQGVVAGFWRRPGEVTRLNEITLERIAGEYVSNAFSVGAPHPPILPSLASISLNLMPDGSVTGRYFVQKGADPRDPTFEIDTALNGTFTYDGLRVRFFLEPSMFVNETAWKYRRGFLNPETRDGRYATNFRRPVTQPPR